MAQFTFKASFVSRSKGQSTIAKAAYNSREVLIDERTGEKTKDYSKDHGPAEWSGIFAPKDAPEWMRDRQRLWNEVEAREDRNTRWKSAQPSRTFIIAIPSEFDTPEKRLRFVTDYGREQARRGWVSDMSIHAPDHDQRNYHLHVQSPLREVTPDGFGKRIRLADRDKGINREDELETQKERFCNLAARHLTRYGHREEAERFRVSYMTLEKQREEALKRGDKAYAKELDREPTIHMGGAAWAMEKDGIRTRKGDQNREINDRNQWRRLHNDIPRDRRPIEDRYLRGALPVWWAYTTAKTPEQFQENLKKEGFTLARATKEDADISRTRGWSKKRLDGGYYPILNKGEYIAINEKTGQAFRLHQHTVGNGYDAVKAFMEPLDKKFINSVRATENIRNFKFVRDDDFGSEKPRNGRIVRNVTRGVLRQADRMMGTAHKVGKVIDTPLKFIEGLSPVISPEQRKLDSELAAERAARQRDQGERDR